MVSLGVFDAMQEYNSYRDETLCIVLVLSQGDTYVADDLIDTPSQ